jgi:hypothetical protein
MTVSIALDSAVEAKESMISQEVVKLVILVQRGDGEGGTISGAEVHVHAGDAWQQRRTNLRGRAVFRNLPRGEVKVQVVAPGWEPFGKRYNMSENESVITIKLEKRH